jgi:phosphoenolpyruvate synthase/pyruvate phosphate dikinase
MPKYVYGFAEGGREMADLLGGKGANLAEMTLMTLMGLPVPPGFTVTTEACRAFLADGTEPKGVADELAVHLVGAGAPDGPRPRSRRRPAAAVGPGPGAGFPRARPGLKVGVCGEHGGDPDSIHFFHDAGLDYVSCSPFRVPVARLEAGRAALTGEPSSRS